MRTGRKIPGNRKPRYCPICGSTMVKKGKPNGFRQQWVCHGKPVHKTQFPSREPITQ